MKGIFSNKYSSWEVLNSAQENELVKYIKTSSNLNYGTFKLKSDENC